MQQDRIETARSVGDIVGRAIRAYRRNVHWAQSLIMPTILVCAGRILWQAAAVMPREQPGAVTAAAVCGVLLAVLGKFELMVRELAFVRLACGQSTDEKTALAWMRRKQWTLAGCVISCLGLGGALSILWLLAIGAASIALKSIPALSGVVIILGFFAFFATVFLIYNCTFLVLASASCDRGDISDHMRQGFSMVNNSQARTMAAGLLIFATVSIISAPFWIPILVLLGLDTLRLGHEVYNGITYPFYWQVIFVSWESLVEMITWPIAFLSYGYYYYDLRLRHEGIDLKSSLSRLTGQATEHGGLSRGDGIQGHIS